MASPPRLGYAILVSERLAELRHFNADVLGLELVEERDDYVKLRAGSVFVALRLPNRAFDRSTNGGAVQLAFPTDAEGVDQWALRLDAAGAPILDPPTDQPWGHRTVFAADPAGNLVEFYAE